MLFARDSNDSRGLKLNFVVAEGNLRMPQS